MIEFPLMNIPLVYIPVLKGIPIGSKSIVRPLTMTRSVGFIALPDPIGMHPVCFFRRTISLHLHAERSHQTFQSTFHRNTKQVISVGPTLNLKQPFRIIKMSQTCIVKIYSHDLESGSRADG
ncbi:hypothetical protein F11_15340 [Rhodospirillum rubrum F11]|nr:hypothetical protein F11_15340 [Rhodospirillum rubrum F11]